MPFRPSGEANSAPPVRRLCNTVVQTTHPPIHPTGIPGPPPPKGGCASIRVIPCFALVGNCRPKGAQSNGDYSALRCAQASTLLSRRLSFEDGAAECGPSAKLNSAGPPSCASTRPPKGALGSKWCCVVRGTCFQQLKLVLVQPLRAPPDRESEGPQQPPRVLPTAPNPGPTPSVKAARCERVEQSVGWGFKDGELFGELRLRATCRLLHTVATRRQRIWGASPVGWGSAHAATHFDSLPSLRAAAARPERGTCVSVSDRAGGHFVTSSLPRGTGPRDARGGHPFRRESKPRTKPPDRWVAKPQRSAPFGRPARNPRTHVRASPLCNRDPRLLEGQGAAGRAYFALVGLRVARATTRTVFGL